MELKKRDSSRTRLDVYVFYICAAYAVYTLTGKCSRFDEQNCFSRILDRTRRFSKLHVKAAFILMLRVGKMIFHRNWQRSLARRG